MMEPTGPRTAAAEGPPVALTVDVCIEVAQPPPRLSLTSEMDTSSVSSRSCNTHGKTLVIKVEQAGIGPSRRHI